MMLKNSSTEKSGRVKVTPPLRHPVWSHHCHHYLPPALLQLLCLFH